MLVTLRELLQPAVRAPFAVPCFNVFGHEESLAIVAAAEALDRGVILACNKEMADLMGVAGFVGLVRHAAEQAGVPVCIHLDHCDDEDRIAQALDAGFSSVMFDGSQLPLADNIARTARVVARAQGYGASVEGEVGSVPYAEGRDHIKRELTALGEAEAFASDSGVDAMAISVGNVHRLREPVATIDFERLAQIEAVTTLPLVIHGTTGITEADLRRLKARRITKFNIATAMRQVFGRSLRQVLADQPELFDRLTMMKPVRAELQTEAERWLRLLGHSSA